MNFMNFNYYNQSMSAVLPMCKKLVHVCFYDCVADILLVLEAQDLFDGSGVGLALIWLILNLR